MTHRTTLLAIFLTISVWVFSACGPHPVVGDPVERAFKERRSEVWVQGQGTVTRVLEDDRAGSRHQRFILKLESGQTLLVQHNIDVAPRIEEVSVGDKVQFAGEYIYNDQGGLIHWTHHDPAGRHRGGWLKHNNRTYE